MLNRAYFTTLAALALTAAPSFAKDKHQPKSEPQDQISILAHIPSTGGPVKRFLTTQHYSRVYLYAEHAAGGGATLIDVTTAKRPSVLADVAFPSSGAHDALLTVTGTAALTTSAPSTVSTNDSPRTIRIMNFSDPQHPQVAHEFTNVTAVEQDTRRGLIYLANPEGIWILQQVYALDPQVEEAYAHHVLYDH